MVENGFASYQHEVEKRGDGGAHDKVAVAAELDEWNDGEEGACKDPTWVVEFGWSKHQP